jgi:hypothetical protein
MRAKKIVLLWTKAIFISSFFIACGGGSSDNSLTNRTISSNLEEVIDDINGNFNGVSVTAQELNAIEGVSGAVEGVNYTKALQYALSHGGFQDPFNPTAEEIQKVIDEANGAKEKFNSFIQGESVEKPTKKEFEALGIYFPSSDINTDELSEVLNKKAQEDPTTVNTLSKIEHIVDSYFKVTSILAHKNSDEITIEDLKNLAIDGVDSLEDINLLNQIIKEKQAKGEEIKTLEELQELIYTYIS